MTDIQNEIEAFETMQAQLEAEHKGEWIVMRERKIINFYQTFELAAAEALRLFGRGPYLIREIGGEPLRLPVSVMYHRYAN